MNKRTPLATVFVNVCSLMCDVFRSIHVIMRHRSEHTTVIKEYVVYPMSVSSHKLEPVYNDIGLYDTSPITADMLCYQLIRHW